jgi:signal transduction histidine kinase
MLQRLRWRSYEPIDAKGSIDRAVMARAFAYLFGAGGTLVLVTLALPSSSDRFVPGMVGPAIAAYGVVLLMLIGFDRLPLWVFRSLPGFGAVLITGVALSSGSGTFNAYALLYFWVVVSAFYFFTWRHAAPNLLVAAAGYALILFHYDNAPDRPLYWVMGISTLVVTSLLLGALRDRIERMLGVLRESDLLKTTILRSVSHDLRTPLTAIMTAGEASGSVNLDEERRREVASVIVGEAGRLSDLVDKLLDISRLEGGAAMPRRTWCSIEEIVEVALDRLPNAGKGFNVTLESTLPPVWADAGQLERAFANLFDNSSRFAGEGRPVEVRLEAGAGGVVVRIADRGPGIDATDRDRIFEPFYRGQVDGARYPGAGLGLAIAKGFIEANGGRIRVAEPERPGATFVVELPAGEATR